MSLIVLLNTSPLGMITNSKSFPENEACKNWLANIADNGVEIVIPEIAHDKAQALLDSQKNRPYLRAGSAGL
jgi:hypothetical protein